MATLAGMAVADKHSVFDSGAAFLLSQKSDINDVIQLTSGSEVEVREGSPIVVARINGAANPITAYNISHEVTQQCLDLLSIGGKANLSTRNASDEYIVWWREGSEQIIRTVSVEPLGLTFGPGPVSLIKDKNGNIVPSALPPATIYNEGFRYFRLSQVTEDVFDAFRNMYLAFELLLETIEPKYKEAEGTWLKRALTKVNNIVPLSRAIKPITADIISDIYGLIYIDIRCKIFHAKSKSRLLPQNTNDRKKVCDGLNKLTQIVLLIAKRWFNVMRASGVMTYSGFDFMTQPLLSSGEIILSDNDSPFSATETLDDTFSNAMPLVTRFAPEYSEPGLNFSLGFIDVIKLKGLKKIARFGLIHQKDLVLVHPIEAELTYDSIDRLEALLGVQLKNLREPKSFFKY